MPCAIPDPELAPVAGSTSSIVIRAIAVARVDLITVNYRGSAPALPDLIAGRVQVMFDPVITAIGPIKAGKLRGLGVTTAQPIEALPDLPPIGEFVPGF